MVQLLSTVALVCIALASLTQAAPPRLSSSKAATRAYARSSNTRGSSSSSSSRATTTTSSKKGRSGTATAASSDDSVAAEAPVAAPANQLQGAMDHLRKTAKRLIEGAKSLPRNYFEADRLKKIRKARGSEALTFKEYKFVERAQEDMGKVFRMLITIPFSPEFFFYSYIVFPTMGGGNPWAWSAMPSGFDADPADERKRTEVLQKRRVQAVIKAITTLKGETVEAGGDAKQLAARERQLAMIERALKSPTMRDALRECAPLLMSENDRRLAPLKLKLRDVPGAIVKDCLRCVGIEGLPNIPLINRFNKGEVAKHFDKVRDSDEFLASIGVPALSAEELEVACRERCIRTRSRPEKALRDDLTTWLDLAMEPVPLTRKNSKAPVLNDQHRRFALMALHAAKGLQQSEFATIYKVVTAQT